MKDKNYRLRKLVIKPTLACTANCPTCQLRRELHKSLTRSRKLTFEQWLKIFEDANNLGVERLDISGGEPTLYKNLAKLIRAGKQYGWYVNVNTNGSLINEEYAEQLLTVGLDSVSISIYSNEPRIHDQMRNLEGLWEKATNAVRIFSGLRGKFPHFQVATQCLICRENYRNLADLMKLNYELGSCSMPLTYLEGDFERKYLLDEDEINHLRKEIVPKAKAFCQTLDPTIRNNAVNVVESIYSKKINSISNFARGLYRPVQLNPSKCQRPKEFTILLANGDVHPCNMVEYSHEPVMGNLFEKSLPEIWHSEKWNRFREMLFDYCQLCPINLYMKIQLRTAREKIAPPTLRYQENQKAPCNTVINNNAKSFSPSLLMYQTVKNTLEQKKLLEYGYPNLEDSQYWPYEKLIVYQNAHLQRILNYAYKHIPGYRRKFNEAGITPTDIKSTDDLCKLPITTREELQNNDDFINRSLIHCVLHTGGSTGTSLEYYDSELSGLIRMDAHLRGWKWSNFKPDMKYCILKSAQSIVREGNCIHLIGDLSNENLKKNLEVVQTFKPMHLKGYVGSLYIFARYCLDNDIRLNGIISTIPSSENLYDYQRQIMEQAFGCKVFEEYCCNDGGACAWECEKREGLHYVMERSVIENIEGKMIVTDLWNYAMPFIRYENGDSVQFLNNGCSCGRELPLIKVKGRTNDVIITPKGVITPSFLLHHGIGLVGVDKAKPNFRSGIRAIQYVQKPGNILELNIVRNPWCTDTDIENLKKDMHQFMHGLQIKLRFVDIIPKTKKGKRAFVINEDKELLQQYLGGKIKEYAATDVKYAEINKPGITLSNSSKTGNDKGNISPEHTLDEENRKRAAIRPKVSMLMAVYNGEKFIEQALKSIYNQTYQDFEVIIVDDASTDKTSDILINMKDSRTFIYRNSQNNGLTKSLNIGLKLCRGEYIARMDADDISHPQRFEKQVRYLDENPECIVLGSWYGRIDSTGQIWGTKQTPTAYEDIKINLLIGNCVGHGSAMLRRSSLVENGGYNEKYIHAQDYDLWLRLSEVGEIRNLGEYLYYLRSWSGTISAAKGKQQIEYAELAFKEALKRKFDNKSLDISAFSGLVGRAVRWFNSCEYSNCISTLNKIETIESNITRRFKNYDLLRAMASFSMNMKEQCLEYLNREIENHNNSAAKKFISDFFKNQIKTDVQSWCRQNAKLYNLRVIDIERESNTQQNKLIVSDRSIYTQQNKPKESQQIPSDNQTNTQISVIIPAYNATEHISMAIESVLNQNYNNFELVIINDGSTDNTEEIVFGFKDERIRYFRQENSGLAATHNTGIRQSRGKFITKLDADDQIMPDFISRHLQEFQKHPQADLIYCDDYLIDENSKPIRIIERPEYNDQKLLIRDLFRSGFPVVPFRTCIRRNVFDKIGFFDENLRIGEDYDMIRRFVKQGLNIHHLPSALYLRRMTENSLSRKSNPQKTKSHFELVKRFVETFRYDELFPDVDWDQIPAEKRQLHAKCLAVVNYLAIGQDYLNSNSASFYAAIAFQNACSELRDCLNIDPDNRQIRELLQKCELGSQKYEKYAVC